MRLLNLLDCMHSLSPDFVCQASRESLFPKGKTTRTREQRELYDSLEAKRLSWETPLFRTFLCDIYTAVMISTYTYTGPVGRRCMCLYVYMSTSVGGIDVQIYADDSPSLLCTNFSTGLRRVARTPSVSAYQQLSVHE